MNRDRNMARTARRQQGTRQLPGNKLSSDQSHYLYLRNGRAGRQQRLHLCTATRRSARGQPFDRGARRVRLLAHVRTWARRLRKRRQQSVPPASSCSSDISPANLAALSRRICAAIAPFALIVPQRHGGEDTIHERAHDTRMALRVIIMQTFIWMELHGGGARPHLIRGHAAPGH